MHENSEISYTINVTGMTVNEIISSINSDTSDTVNWHTLPYTDPNPYPLVDPYQFPYGYLSGTPTVTDWGVYTPPVPKKVNFHPPRTVVYWEDGTKTVVKAAGGDVFNKLTGFLLAFYEKSMNLSKKQNSIELEKIVSKEVK